ncbi:hypothetical protein AB4Z54_63410, partial [Streptomyces sp. MCAF7]
VAELSGEGTFLIRRRLAMSNDPRHDRYAIALALVGTGLVGLVAVLYPVLIPALSLALAAFMAIALFLKL